MQQLSCKFIVGLFLAIGAACLVPHSVWAEAAPVPPTRPFSGAITARTTDLLSVEANVFSLNKQTVWMADGQAVTDTSLFDVGDIVVVRATQINSTWVALEVDLMANVVPDSGDTVPAATPLTATFSGPIENVGTNAISVEATVLSFDAQTQWIVAGTATKDLSRFNVGDQVVANAQFDGKTWLLTSVELVVDAGPAPTPTPPAPAPAPQPPLQSGITLAPGGSTDTQTFSGRINALSDTNLDLADASFEVNAQTLWTNADGSAAAKSSFGVGDTVQVTGQKLGGAWTASKVTLLQHSAPAGGANR